MEVLKVSLIYFLSILASKTLKLITPIKFEDVELDNSYTTKIDEGKVTYIITVKQWCKVSKTRIVFFNSNTKYYLTETLILLDNKVVEKRNGFFPEPVRGRFSSTKFPHAVIALDVLDKIKSLIKVEDVAETA